jgi:hypothetical protein
LRKRHGGTAGLLVHMGAARRQFTPVMAAIGEMWKGFASLA